MLKERAGLVVRNMDEADERRQPPGACMDIITMGGTTLARLVAEPGWKWSESVKPVAGTDSCEVAHTGYLVSGTLHVKMDDGQEVDLHAGDMCTIDSGHDAWVVGNDPVQFLEMSAPAAQEYATARQ